MQVYLNTNNYFQTSNNKTKQRPLYNNNINFNAKFTKNIRNMINPIQYALKKIVECPLDEDLYPRSLELAFPYKIDSKSLAKAEQLRIEELLRIIERNYPNHKIVRRVNVQPTKAGLPKVQYYLVPENFKWQEGRTWNVAQVAASTDKTFSIGDLMNIASSLQRDLQFSEEIGFNYYANVIRPATNKAFQDAHTELLQ